MEAGLGNSKARHNLAELYLEPGQSAEAEAYWRAALAVEPDYGPLTSGLWSKPAFENDPSPKKRVSKMRSLQFDLPALGQIKKAAGT